MRRAVILWSGVAVLVALGFVVAVAVLNATLYSAHGYVHGYLDALERRDSDAAREYLSESASAEARTDLLADAAMGLFSEIDLVSDTTRDDGTHDVEFEFDAGGLPGSSEFRVEQVGTRFGLFPVWGFVENPVGTLTVTALHDDRFDVNQLHSVRAQAPDEPAPFLVFAPGAYTLDHTSALLAAQPVRVTVTHIGGTVDAAIDVRANESFISTVQAQVDAFLDACAEQRVLMPTGCPFGADIDNRVDALPTWAIADYPVVTIVPGDTAGSWQIPRTPGSAHIVVDIRSLFDGTVTTLDEEVAFTIAYDITIEDESRLVLAPVEL